MKRFIFLTLIFNFLSHQALANDVRCFFLYRDKDLSKPTQELLRVDETLNPMFGDFATIELRQANYVMYYGETVALVFKSLRITKSNNGSLRKYEYSRDFVDSKRTILGHDFDSQFLFQKIGHVENFEFGMVQFYSKSFYYKEHQCIQQ